jgi:hypothetical protein
LIRAELIREVIYKDLKSGKEGQNKEIVAIWSNGIVLQRNCVREEQGAVIRYERMGRFWME